MSKFITLISFVLSTCTAIAPVYAADKGTACVYGKAKITVDATGKTVISRPYVCEGVK